MAFWLNNDYSGVSLPDYGTYSVMVATTRDTFDTANIEKDDFTGMHITFLIFFALAQYVPTVVPT